MELCSSQRHSCTHSRCLPHLAVCAFNLLLYTSIPPFAATPCFTSNLMSAPPRLTAFSTQPEHAQLTVGYVATEPRARNRGRGFRPGTKFCYALTSIAIHSQSVSQNLAQSLSGAINQPSIWKTGFSEASSSSIKHFILSSPVHTVHNFCPE